ncbi:hypothetical protein MNBD_ALPHA02-1713 [hydrothermal vent metagenome]|uniref:Uncharacterized protein n=1 Tax=hydrothermal vent metagenome TaxID=652676 RepID=A0A3B0RY14_9ZZZZ
MAKTDYKQQLQDDRMALQKLIALAGDESNAVELDQSKLGRLSRMDALQKQAMSQEVLRRRQIELMRINAALIRIEEGEFGYCITCGEEIECQRLALNPSLPQCGKCAAA